MFDYKKNPEKPINVDITHRSEMLDKSMSKMYIGYRMDHERNLELIGVFNEQTVKEMSSNAYIEAIKEKYAGESMMMAMMGAAFAKKTVDELMSFKIVLIPLPMGTIFNDYKVTTIKEEEVKEEETPNELG